MASKSGKLWHMIPIGWIISGLILAFCSGMCFTLSSYWWILLAICSINCGILAMRGIERIKKRMRFVMDATVSGDFSYKFPTDHINKEERESNQMLNNIVEHFESLTKEVRQNEVFLARMINLTDIGLEVADDKGDIRLHNDASIRLLERQVLTNVCQIPHQACGARDR